MFNKRLRGFTLVEMIIAMVIISAGVAGVIGVLSRTSVASADPMIVKQMAAIAEGMMDEIQLKPFGTPTPPAAPPATCNRTAFEDIWDYNGYIQSACAVNGDEGPAGHQVSVGIVQGSGAITTGGIQADHTAIITIVVTHGTDNYTLVGWRTRF